MGEETATPKLLINGKNHPGYSVCQFIKFKVFLTKERDLCIVISDAGGAGGECFG